MKLPSEMKSAISKAIKEYRTFETCAYIYRDGIALWCRDVPVKVGKNKVTTNLWYFWRTPVSIGSYGNKKFQGNIVLHNATILLDGIEYVDVYSETLSEAMTNSGIPSGESVTLHTHNGMQIRLYKFPFLSSDVSIQYANMDGTPSSIEMLYDSVHYGPDGVIVVQEEN